jgi:hypothetical protein
VSSKTVLPYLMVAIPVTSVDARQVTDEPYNNLKNHEVLFEGVKECEMETIIVCDSHYLDLEGVSGLRSFLLIFARPLTGRNEETCESQ